VRFAVVLGFVALMVSSCSGLSGSRRAQVGEWANGASYDSANAQIQSDLSYLSAAARARQVRDFQADCEGFSGDVETLYETLPTPDVMLTNELNHAFEDWFAASADCENATSLTSVAYVQAQSEIKRGQEQYTRAIARLASFGIR
jgi:hypothetical protein